MGGTVGDVANTCRFPVILSTDVEVSHWGLRTGAGDSSDRAAPDDADPDGAFVYPDTKPATARPLPRAYEGAPPQVPHDVSDFL
ncbi:MAG: hypothetical protein WCA45_05725, partial [Thiobacillaceae bacterium]